MNHDPIELLAAVLLRGALLLPLCLFAALLLRRGSAALIRRFWRCSLVALLLASTLTIIPPALTFEVASDLPLVGTTNHVPTGTLDSDLVPGSPVTPLEHLLGLEVEESASPAGSLPTQTSAHSSPFNSTPALSWPLLLASLWILGVLILLVRKLTGSLGVARLRKSAQPVDDPAWNNALANLREELGLMQRIELRSHLALRSPIVTGSLNPIIILPLDYPDYSSEDRRAVLLHELSHVEHRDAFFRWVATLVKLMHWPNPLVWYAERSLRLAEERASDDAVLGGGVPAPRYAELLARLAKGGAPVVGDLGVTGGSAMAQPSGLLHRVHAILRPNQIRRRPGFLSSMAVIVAGLTASVLVGSSTFLKADSKTKPAATKSVSSSPANRIDEKLRSIIIPDVNFEDTTLDEALDYIRQRSRDLDPESKGINIISKVQPNRLPDGAAVDLGGARTPLLLSRPSPSNSSRFPSERSSSSSTRPPIPPIGPPSMPSSFPPTTRANSKPATSTFQPRSWSGNWLSAPRTCLRPTTRTPLAAAAGEIPSLP